MVAEEPQLEVAGPVTAVGEQRTHGQTDWFPFAELEVALAVGALAAAPAGRLEEHRFQPVG